ncbi:hypothetical protein ORI20_01145 [Mycobacterium sp. CVI_P3]|uniref:PPE family protein n=1 Tax=Mycobacterium pinniadriaticum TaxID=2994102 RepID=A0ABT3S8N6_9MYCO|nr:hypothetical protein [Mycobacterium pinniadriaticum]MCX2928861.1 hypothetical protein [Mycobacterium pinniadriaticum]MCX2935272.1 hypothetical protein [Mycobacterium pinniadriaticum]
MNYRTIAVHAAAWFAGAAAVVTVPFAALSAVANADPGLGWGAPGPGILPGLGFGGVGGPASGLGVLPGAGLGAPGPGLVPGPGLGGLGGPLSGLGVLPGAGIGLPGPGVI